MRTLLRTACCTVILAGAAIGNAIGCASKDGESIGATDSTGEAISTTDHYNRVAIYPVQRPGLPIHKPTPNVFSHNQQSGPIQTAGSGQLTYRGGPLVSHAKVQVVLWGPNVDSNISSQLPGYYTAVTNSAYFDWLSEYNAGGATIGRGSFIGMTTITPSTSATSITDQTIASELDRQITGGHLPVNDANTIYMVYFPSNISISMQGSRSCVQFCAFHSTYQRSNGNLYFGVMPDLGGACAGGCGAGSKFQSTTSVSSHELIETVTDPAVGLNVLSWYDDAQGEIGDICNAQEGSVAGYTVQKEWSNRNGACIVTDPNVPPPPQDGGAPPPPPPQDAGAPDSGGPPDAGQHDSGNPPPPPPPPPPPGTCSVAEVEPNDTPQDADSLDTCRSGALDPAGDIDMSWFSLSGSVPYDIKLVATGDANLKLYKLVSNRWSRVANTTSTEVAHTSSGGGTYLAVVSSSSSSTQTYTLTRQ